MRTFTTLKTAAAVGLLAFAACAAPTSAYADEPAPAATAQSLYATPGPHRVATPVTTNPCQQSVYGMIAHITVTVFGNASELQCTQAFPGGLESPIGVNTYYPADIADLPEAPLVVLTGGILSVPGNYDQLARLYASHGFVVVIPYDFFNSTVDVPTLGLAVAILADRDAASPLHDRIDLSRTFFAGHSGGGQASLQAGTLYPAIAALIDPSLRIAGVLAIEPGPLAVGALIGVPTLFLTGYNDIVVPDFAWVRWWQYNLMFNAPSWIANARGVTHFSPVDAPENYRAAGTSVAWLKYLAFGDETAKHYFVGADWQLPADKTFFSVERNAQANALN
ncbi:alpha/beta hydrolase [Nocardia yamanashiensis]|uniref:poly(ethylene terephthalate) hydrolase family protein n=1 Tax=Nocardia yamanashiensis TaxID=209247 RepID=UPI001E305EA3|nr:alpha/beta hydrolase [Nocardia yamanashiensis]UGT45000.1 alpha/beta hydrolase [Nocardia yamanashiensis]